MIEKNGNSKLAKKIAIIVSAAIATLGIQKTEANVPANFESNEKTIDFAKAGKSKPVSALKLNSQNLNQGRLVAQHRSHSSHSSHSSHHSHYSGALYS